MWKPVIDVGTILSSYLTLDIEAEPLNQTKNSDKASLASQLVSGDFVSIFWDWNYKQVNMPTGHLYVDFSGPKSLQCKHDSHWFISLVPKIL